MNQSPRTEILLTEKYMKLKIHQMGLTRDQALKKINELKHTILEKLWNQRTKKKVNKLNDCWIISSGLTYT